MTIGEFAVSAILFSVVASLMLVSSLTFRQKMGYAAMGLVVYVVVLGAIW